MFEVGDVVQLKSGGCKMTIGSIFQDRYVCHFFDGQGEYDSETFPGGALKKISGSKKKTVSPL